MTQDEMRNLRLECLRIAGGNLGNAIKMYEWLVEFPRVIVPAPAPAPAAGCGTIVIPVANTNWDI